MSTDQPAASEPPAASAPASSAPEKPPAPAKPTLSEEARDRRVSIVTALIAGALGGVLAAIVSLIVTNQQIGSQESLTEKQIRSQTEEAQRQFLQNQRRSVYSAFVADERELSASEVGLRLAVHPELWRPTASSFKPLRASYNSSYRNTWKDMGNVEVLGSSNAVEVMKKIRDIHADRLYWVIVADTYASSRVLPRGTTYEEIAAGLDKSDKDPTSLREEFVRTARADLKTG